MLQSIPRLVFLEFTAHACLHYTKYHLVLHTHLGGFRAIWWLEYFVQQIHSSEESLVLLILDGHQTTTQVRK